MPSFTRLELTLSRTTGFFLRPCQAIPDIKMNATGLHNLILTFGKILEKKLSGCNISTDCAIGNTKQYVCHLSGN